MMISHTARPAIHYFIRAAWAGDYNIICHPYKINLISLCSSQLIRVYSHGVESESGHCSARTIAFGEEPESCQFSVTPIVTLDAITMDCTS